MHSNVIKLNYTSCCHVETSDKVSVPTVIQTFGPNITHLPFSQIINPVSPGYLSVCRFIAISILHSITASDVSCLLSPQLLDVLPVTAPSAGGWSTSRSELLN